MNTTTCTRMPSAARCTVVAALALLLSGCFASPQPKAADSASEGGPSWTPWSVKPEFLDCRAIAIMVFADRQKMEDSLPPGFAAASVVPGFSDVNLEIYACAAVVIDNQTVLKEVTLAGVWVFVKGPPGVDDPGLIDLYSLELFTDSLFLRDLLVAHGVPAQLATIQLTDVGPGQEAALVEIPGQLRYDGTVLSDEGSHGRDVAPLQRKHHHLFRDRPAWFYLNTTHYQNAEYPRAVVLEASGGFLSTTPFGSTLPSASGTATLSAIMDFGRLD